VSTAQALDELRAKLESSFGKAMAMMVLAAASNSLGIPTMDLSADEFHRLAKAVCDDQRVKDMWGTAGAIETADQWCRLVA
jgi:hypothetical protein